MSHRVTLIPGDWIGPETTAVACRLIALTGVQIDWERFEDLKGEVPEALLDSARSTGAVLMARVDSDPAPGKLPVTIQLRRSLGMYAQVRHVRNLPGLPARFDNVNLAIVRETSEDIYTGIEHESAPGVYESIRLTTQAACERIAQFAFERAVQWKRKKLTIVHKANILKRSDGLFLRTAQEVAKAYPQIECNEVIVDALCMHLVRNPSRFDVLLCGNLFGDIVSDLAAGLAGGICVGGAANYGENIVMFENPHGKAPALAGSGRANPIPILIQGISLLHHLGEKEAANRLSKALKTTLPQLQTVDKGGEDGCEAVEAALSDAL
jgi:isocitrate dehydrogenase (NAD+)